MKSTVKRILSFVLCLALLLSFASCKRQQNVSLGTTTGENQGTTQADSQPYGENTTDNSTGGEAGEQPAEGELNPNCTHADADSDLYCDNCLGYLIVELNIFAINDIHGKFTDSESQPGVDELTTYLQTRQGNVVLLSSGDTWQGSSESNLTYGKLMVEWMNRTGFDAMTLGNHEFDWGTQYIAQNAEYAQFPFLAINVYETATKKRAEYCQPSVVVELGGIKVGIIGAIGDCYGSIAGDKVEDVYFITGTELTKLVKAEAESLQKQGVDVIIYSIHDGHDKNGASGTVSSYQLKPYYDTSLSNGLIDIVFEGHTHKNYVFKDEHGVYHMQGGGENKGVSHAEITYNALTDGITQVSANYVQSNSYSSYEKSPIVEEILKQFESVISKGYEKLGFNGKKRSDSELREIVAKLYYESGVQRWGSKYKIALGGGSISVRNPYSLSAGEVTYSMLQQLLPFDNDIVLCSISGADLQRRFINTTYDNYAVFQNPDIGSISPNETYYIVTDTWSSGYEPNRCTVVETYDQGVYCRDLLADYIKSGGLDNGLKTDGYTLTDIPTVLNIGKALQRNGETRDSYYVKGKITKIENTTYGNLYIADENGNSIYVYGLYDLSGHRFDSMPNKPKVGDEVVLYSTVKNYQPPSGSAIVELMNATLIK